VEFSVWHAASYIRSYKDPEAQAAQAQVKEPTTPLSVPNSQIIVLGYHMLCRAFGQSSRQRPT
jgi:hypothetical protein